MPRWSGITKKSITTNITHTMDTITITLTSAEAERINAALNLQAVHIAGNSKTIGVDCLHPDFWHREWNEATALWLKVYNAIHPETEKED